MVRASIPVQDRNIRKREGTMNESTPTGEQHECSNCRRSTLTGLELLPSGKGFRAHKIEEGSSERCTGGKPVKLAPPTSEGITVATTAKGDCPECGTGPLPRLKSGKLRKHPNPNTLEPVCQQREDVQVECPIDNRMVALRFGKLAQHNDLKKRTRCPGSNKTPTEAKAVKIEAPTRPPAEKPAKKAATPKPKSEAAATYKALPGIARSQLKAKRLADELATYKHPWTATYETAPDTGTVTLSLHRGKAQAVELMQISWFDGACIGGEGRITHEYRGRKIAVRNASAIKQRALLSPEEVAAEYSKVSARKAAGPPKGKRTPKPSEELKQLLPFNPETATDEEIMKAVLNKPIVWDNATSGKRESDVVKSGPKINTTTKGLRNLSFRGVNTSRTVRVAALVSVG